MRRAFDHLGLPDYPLPSYEILNTEPYPQLGGHLQDRLKRFYAPHNKRLENLLQQEFQWS